MRGRLLAAVSFTLLGWLALLLALAWTHAPWQDSAVAEARVLAPAAWQTVLGAGSRGARAYRIERFDPSGAALLVARPEPFEAASRPVLRLALEGLPATHVLMFAWRTAGSREQAFVRLQPATGGAQSYHLGREAAWRGRIEELALYTYPQQQSAPPEGPGRPVDLVRFELGPDGLLPRIRALATGWLAPDPWEMLSISSLGALRDLREGVRLEPAVAGAAAIAFGVFGLLLAGRDRRRWLGVGLTVFLAAVLLLWLKAMVGLAAQRGATGALYAGLAPDERALEVFDQELVRLARRAAAALPGPGQARVFIGTDDRFFQLRAGWHLRPHNVITAGLDARVLAALRPGDYLFVYRRPDLLAAVRAGLLPAGPPGLALEPVLVAGETGALARVVEAGP